MLCVFTLISGAPSPPVMAQGGPPALRVPYSEFTLANGLHVILHRDASVPVVSVNVWYHVGSANERPGRTGFAHLFEHLMFEGSKNVREGAFDEWLEAAGGNNNGSTTTDRTNYYIDVAGQRPGDGAVSRIGSHGVSARADDAGARERAARCGQERAPAELRERAVRQGVSPAVGAALSAEPPVSLVDDWLDGGSRRPRATKTSCSSSRPTTCRTTPAS